MFIFYFLKDNEIGDEGAIYLSNMFYINKTLTHIELLSILIFKYFFKI